MIIAACGGDDDRAPDPLVVRTTSGRVRGIASGELRIFRGIPYAAPPVGALRFRPPQPHSDWDGVRDADAYGPACPQVPSPLTGPDRWDEDCLTINVWAHSDEETHPVVVFVHGGAFVGGHASNPRSDGSVLAADTDAIVVSFNYRLGILGYLAIDELREPDGAVGNYGLRDQLRALEWVRDNIAAFGGDPDRVTLLGESAGAFSVCLLVGLDRAEGLFHGAILHSGGCSGFSGPHRPGLFGAAAFDVGADVTAVVGCSGATDVARCLRELDAGVFVDAVSELAPNAFSAAPTTPVIDGVFVEGQPIESIRQGGGSSVPVLAGSTADDYSLFAAAFRVMNANDLEERMGAVLDPVPSQLLELYDPARFQSGNRALSEFMTDYAFACPTLTLGNAMAQRGLPGYVFHFTHTVDGTLRDFGSFHGLDYGLVFGNDDPLVELSATDRALAASMRRTWASFFREGAPTFGDGSPWPPYDPSDPAIQIIDAPSSTAAEIRDGRCEDLERLSAVP